MAEIKYIKCNVDDFGIIQLAMQTLNITEQQAVACMLEIGLANFLSYPTGKAVIDEKLGTHQMLQLVQKLKAVYCL